MGGAVPGLVFLCSIRKHTERASYGEQTSQQHPSMASKTSSCFQVPPCFAPVPTLMGYDVEL